MNGLIFDIQRFCIHDGDGIRTAVFLKGCPLSCLWCHNPESKSFQRELLFYFDKCIGCGKCADVCGARRISGDRLVFNRAKCVVCGKCVDVCPTEANELCGCEISADAVFTEVMKDEAFYSTSGGGMTISGGEPSMQSEFTLELLRLAKENNINSAIETCGFGKRDFFETAAEFGATFLYDIKSIDSEKHRQLTSQTNELILSNLTRLFELQARVVIRIPLIPGANDSDSDIRLLIGFLDSCRQHFERIEILPYHNYGIGKYNALGLDSPIYQVSESSERAKILCGLLAQANLPVVVLR